MPFLNVDIFDDLPLRLKKNTNPYLSKLKDAQSLNSLPILFGSDLKNIRGQWRTTFEKDGVQPLKKLILEIGVHTGKVIRSLAMDHLDLGFIGMDITLKRVVMSAQRLKEANATNGRIVLGNAKFLSKIFAEKELDGLILFFPDPWKKNSQAHNRLVNREFCCDLRNVLTRNGFFWLKTDSLSYFEEAKTLLESMGFQMSPSAPFPSPYESVFEKRFRTANSPIYEGIWVNL